jgi:DNA-binding GntR family transcriptional regulator
MDNFNLEVQSLTKSVLEYIRNRIITGGLAPGQRLNENELASRLKVSRPPIREAFRVLESEHLVVSVPRKGAYVTELSADDLLEVYQTREMIECYAVNILKARKIKDLPQVESTLEAASSLPIPSSEDPEQFLDFHKELAAFHFKLVEAAGNSRLVHFYKAISFNLARYQYKYLRLPGSLEISIKEHRQVLDALKKGDYVLAKKNLRYHINKRLKGASKIKF